MSIRVTRRRLFSDSAKIAGGVFIFGTGLAFLGHRSKSSASQALRPPGARNGDEFLGACVRCGLCVEACPFDTLKLAVHEDPVPAGTPFFEARKIPCEMCEDLPCVKACPSGALDPALVDVDAAKMGVAVLIDPETCLNMQGLRCDVCYRECPLLDRAISLEMRRNPRTGAHAIFAPTVHADACTGCGKCEHVCVLEEAAIKVVPAELARGRLGEHYRFGWKDDASESLPQFFDPPDRLPQEEAP